MITVVPSAPDAGSAGPRERLLPVPRALLRWALIVGLTVLAFRQSLLSLVDGTRAGSLIGYVWLLVGALLVAGIAISRQQRNELPIHDRQTDVIVGGLGMLMALMVHGILLQRYSQYYLLLRIDLIALWFFVISSSILLFGLRPLARFAWVWTLPLFMLPLAYQVTVILFGGSRVAAGAATLLVSSAATAIAVGRNRIRALVGAVMCWTVGLVLLAGMAVMAPQAPLLAFQVMPAGLSMLLVCSGLFLQARRGVTKRPLQRSIRPLAAGQVWAAIPVVVAVAVLLSLVSPPKPGDAPTWVSGATFGVPLAVPVGWHVTEKTDYSWVRRLHGRDATLIRQRFVADVGDPRWDKYGRPRTLMVDSTSTWRPISLQEFPATVLYDESSSRLSPPKSVDLGHGVKGELYSVVDDKLLVTFGMLIWTWRTEGSEQRVVVSSVDNHEEDAPFPTPTGGLAPTLRTMFSVLFRGNAVTLNREPTEKDFELLTGFGRALVDAQRPSAGRPA